MATVSRREVALDLLGLALVPAVLVAVFLLVPPTVQRTLAFDHGDPRPYAPLTAAYVHATPGHLLSNLVAYVVAAGFTHRLCLASDGRRWFWRTVPVFLTVLPVLVGLTDWAVFAALYPARSFRALGFSGVAAGFGGMLLVALVRFVRVRSDAALARAVGVGASLLVLQVAALRVDTGATAHVTGVAVAGGLLLGGWCVVRRGRRVGVGRPTAAVVGLVLSVLVAVVLALFPDRGGALTGVVAHAAGLGWGVAVSLATGYATDDG